MFTNTPCIQMIHYILERYIRKYRWSRQKDLLISVVQISLHISSISGEPQAESLNVVCKLCSTSIRSFTSIYHRHCVAQSFVLSRRLFWQLLYEVLWICGNFIMHLSIPCIHAIILDVSTILNRNRRTSISFQPYQIEMPQCVCRTKEMDLVSYTPN